MPDQNTIVQKFGGTSVGSPEKILDVADRIAADYKLGKRLVIVVSAMGHTTDELIRLAKQVSKEPLEREMDMLLTVGERISMSLLSLALNERKIPAVSLTGSQAGIVTDLAHSRARIKRILGDRVREGLDQGKVVIVAGFQGVSEAKEITTLGRGGSDTTAVALACALNLMQCEIYTDVDGVYSVDPRLITKGAKGPQGKAVHYSRVGYDQMILAAHLGSQVLHPRSVELAKAFKIKLFVKDARDKKKNPTMTEVTQMENHHFKTITMDDKKAVLEVELMRASQFSAILDYSKEHKLSITLPVLESQHVRFFYEKSDESAWQKGLSRLATDGFIKRYEFQREWIPVSAVGDRFTQDGSALGEMMDHLSKNEILIKLGVASPISITFAIESHKAKDAVAALHTLCVAS